MVRSYYQRRNPRSAVCTTNNHGASDSAGPSSAYCHFRMIFSAHDRAAWGACAASQDPRIRGAALLSLLQGNSPQQPQFNSLLARAHILNLLKGREKEPPNYSWTRPCQYSQETHQDKPVSSGVKFESFPPRDHDTTAIDSDLTNLPSQCYEPPLAKIKTQPLHLSSNSCVDETKTSEVDSESRSGTFYESMGIVVEETIGMKKNSTDPSEHLEADPERSGGQAAMEENQKIAGRENSTIRRLSSFTLITYSRPRTRASGKQKSGFPEPVNSSRNRQYASSSSSLLMPSPHLEGCCHTVVERLRRMKLTTRRLVDYSGTPSPKDIDDGSLPDEFPNSNSSTASYSSGMSCSGTSHSGDLSRSDPSSRNPYAPHLPSISITNGSPIGAATECHSSLCSRMESGNTICSPHQLLSMSVLSSRTSTPEAQLNSAGCVSSLQQTFVFNRVERRECSYVNFFATERKGSTTTLHRCPPPDPKTIPLPTYLLNLEIESFSTA